MVVLTLLAREEGGQWALLTGYGRSLFPENQGVFGTSPTGQGGVFFLAGTTLPNSRVVNTTPVLVMYGYNEGTHTSHKSI